MESNFNPKDKVTVDIPLLIRLLEYAREDAKTDMDLHNVAENLISLSETGKTLTMSDYETIVKQPKNKLMENSFNLKKFLVENKLTTNSKLLEETSERDLTDFFNTHSDVTEEYLAEKGLQGTVDPFEEGAGIDFLNILEDKLGVNPVSIGTAYEDEDDDGADIYDIGENYFLAINNYTGYFMIMK